MTVDVSRFFSNTDGSVYALQNLPEEVVAYLFARYSRSTLSLRDDLRQMIEAEDMGALIGGAASPEARGRRGVRAHSGAGAGVRGEVRAGVRAQQRG